MRVVFFGLGSIGLRHLRNLREYVDEHGIDLSVTAVRTGASFLPDLADVQQVRNLSDARGQYDVAFITNPTGLHEQTLRLLDGRADVIFLEKPAFTHVVDPASFAIAPERVYVAAPLRYKLVMNRVRELVAKERVLNARVVCSSFLPDWRPGDYRHTYSASKTMGGGVELDCIHEVDYVISLFGSPNRTTAIAARHSDLEITSNDVAAFILDYDSLFVEIHLDYFGRVPQRTMSLTTAQDRIEVDLLANCVTRMPTGDRDLYDDPPGEMYRREMAYFMESVVPGHANWNDLNRANEALRVVQAVQCP